jgi:hypothetical protein
VIEWNVLPDPSSAVDISEGASSSSSSSRRRRRRGAGRPSLLRGAGEEEDDQDAGARAEDEDERPLGGKDEEEDQEEDRDKDGEEEEDEDGADQPPLEVSFSYTAEWKRTETRYADRLARYERLPLNPVHLEIHWFSIVNSCVTVLLLTGFMATILMRVLRADLARYARVGGGGGDGGALLESGGGGAGGLVDDDDESGWKHLHGDVFRFPPRRSLLAAFLGTGTQLLLLSVCIFALALLGSFHPHNRGAMFTALIVLYALTAGVAGYVSASTYRQHGGGKGWARNIALTVAIYCAPFAIIWCLLNTVAIAYRSTAALPFGTIVVMIVLWSLVTIPLTVLGGVAGKNSAREYDAPCR